MRILLVDDDGDSLYVTRHFLSRESPSFEVHSASSAGEALEKVSSGDFDCLVSDFDMPGMSGLDLLAELRARDLVLPFVVLTAQGSEEIAAEAFRSGANDYFVKDERNALYSRLANSIIKSVESHRRMLARRQAEEISRQSETRFRELFENMGSAVAVYRAVDDGRDFEFVDFNKAGEEIEKLSREEIIGRRVTEVFPGIEEFGLLEILGKVWATGEPVRYPAGLYKDSRIEGWRDNRVYRLPSGEVVAVYDDITKRMQSEKRQGAMLRDLEDFSQIVSRDLMGPLTSMKCFSRILLDECAAALDENGRECVQRLWKNALMLEKLLAGLFEITRVDRQRDASDIVAEGP